MDHTLGTSYQIKETVQPYPFNACLCTVCVNTVSLHLNPHCRIDEGLEIEGVEIQ